MRGAARRPAASPPGLCPRSGPPLPPLTGAPTSRWADTSPVTRQPSHVTRHTSHVTESALSRGSGSQNGPDHEQKSASDWRPMRQQPKAETFPAARVPMRQQPKAETFPAARVPGRQQSKAQTFPATRVPGRGQPMRRLFTTRQLQASGVTRSSLNWHVKKGRLTRVITSVYAEGPSKPSAIDRARATVLVTNGVASGCLAGLLLGFDDIRLNGPYVTVDPGRSNRRAGIQRREVPPERVVTVQGVPCTDALFTLVDLAAIVRDDVW